MGCSCTATFEIYTADIGFEISRDEQSTCLTSGRIAHCLVEQPVILKSPQSVLKTPDSEDLLLEF